MEREAREAHERDVVGEPGAARRPASPGSQEPAPIVAEFVQHEPGRPDSRPDQVGVVERAARLREGADRERVPGREDDPSCITSAFS